MEKTELIKCIDYFEKEITRLEQEKIYLIKNNIKIDKIDITTRRYKEIISEFSKKLLNSSYILDIRKLANLLEDYIEFYDLTKGTYVNSEMDTIIKPIFVEFKRLRQISE